MQLLTALQSFPLLRAQRLYESKLQLPYTMEPFQHEDWTMASTEEKAVFIRSRGGSKTRDFTNWLIFHVLRTRQQWIWLSCKSGQLQQAIFYVKQNPFVKYVQRETASKYNLTLWNGSTLRFGIISTSNLGLRVDGIVYDEFEDLQPAQELDVYPQMAGMMSHSSVHKTIYLGTLWIQALLNDYAQQYPCSVRPWDTIPWLVASGMIQQEIDDAVTPDWEIDMMYRCIPTAPSGVLFPSLKTEDLSELVWDRSEMSYGLDFGGKDTCVGVVLRNNDAYIVEEYSVELELYPEALDHLLGHRIECESGGYNDSDKYGNKSRLISTRLHASKQPVTNKWKAARQMEARRYQLHCDPKLTPNAYKDVKGATFGPDGLYLKDTAHPCHYLDAFFHAIRARESSYVDAPLPRAHSIYQIEARRERRTKD